VSDKIMYIEFSFPSMSFSTAVVVDMIASRSDLNSECGAESIQLAGTLTEDDMDTLKECIKSENSDYCFMYGPTGYSEYEYEYSFYGRTGLCITHDGSIAIDVKELLRIQLNVIHLGVYIEELEKWIHSSHDVKFKGCSQVRGSNVNSVLSNF